MTRTKTGGYVLSVGRNSLNDGQQKSRPEQEAITRAAAEQYGLPVPSDGFYFDMLSRSEWPRPGLDAALKRLEQDPNCRGLVVWNSDRTIGDEWQCLEVYELLADADAYLIEGDPYRAIDPSNEAERLIGLINSWKADQEAKRTRRRVHGTHRQKVLRGKYVSRPVYGLRSVGPVKISDRDEADPARLAARIAERERRANERLALNMVEPDPLRGWIIRDEPALEWVRKIWTWIAHGSSAYSVCVRLRDAGVPSANGKTDWSTMSLRHLLDNPMYMGIMKWDQTKTTRPRNRKTGSRTTKRVKRDVDEHLLIRSPFGVLLAVPHKGMDDPDHNVDDCSPCQAGITLWKDARLIIGARTTQADTRRKHAPGVFDPFVRCARCGKKMYHRKLGRRLRKDGTRLIAFEYRCATRRNTAQACTEWHSIHERYVINAFHAIASLGELPPAVVVRLGEIDHAVPDERMHLKERRNELEAERGRMVRLLAQSTVTEEDFQTFDGTWLNEMKSLDARLDAIAPVATPKRDAELTVECGEAFSRVWGMLQEDQIPVEERQAVLTRLVERIEIDAPNITIVWVNPDRR